MKTVYGLVALVAMLFGCAGVGPAAEVKTTLSIEQQVIARAEARWKLMIAKDLDAAYSYLSPGSQGSNPLTMFKAKIRPLDWKSAVGVSADCGEDQCRVKVRIRLSDKRLGGDVETVVEETWLKASGQWWLVFNQ